MAKAKYTQGKDGYFQTKVWDGTYIDGRKNRITLRTKKSSGALEKMVIEHNNRLKDRQYVRPIDITFYDYAVEWAKVYKSNLSKNTIAMYNNIINKHLINVSCKMSDVNRTFYHTIINDTQGARTKQQISMTFKQIVRSAIKDKILPAGVYDDIFVDSIKIKYKSPEKRALTDNEKTALFKANFSPSDKALVYILYGCGLRRGEALALTRFDISLERMELTVNKALGFDGNNSYLKATKTENGHRTVPIPDIVSDYISDYVKSLHGTILFPSRNGEYISKSSYCKKWDRILRQMNFVSDEPIEDLTAHIFRHNYCASLCYKIPEISIGKVAELLGDTEKMVIEVYNHVIEKKEKPHEVVTSALAL